MSPGQIITCDNKKFKPHISEKPPLISHFLSLCVLYALFLSQVY